MQAKLEARHRIIAFAFLWTALATLLRTIRWPNDWSEAYWLISYELGFLKRGLPGSLLAPLLSIDAVAPHAEWLIRIAASSVLALFCAALFWIVVRFLVAARDGLTAQLAGLVFLTSPFLVMSAHLNGYFDSFVLLASIVACWLVLRGRVLAASIVVSLGLLVHEAVVLLGFPSVLFVALLKHIDESDATSTLRSLLGFIRRNAVLIAVPLCVFLWIFAFHTFLVDAAELKVRLLAHFEQFDFILRNKDTAVARAHSLPFWEHLESQGRFFRSRISKRAYQLEVIPPTALLLYHFWRYCRGRAYSLLLFLLGSCITALPLVLHAVAWDINRIWMHPIMVSALTAWCAYEVLPPAQPEGRLTKGVYALLAAVVIVAQIYGTTPLLDKQVERFTSFQRTLLYAPTMLFLIFSIVRELRSEFDREVRES